MQAVKAAIKKVAGNLISIEWISIPPKCQFVKNTLEYKPDLLVSFSYEGRKQKAIVLIKASGEPKTIAQVGGIVKTVPSDIYAIIVAPYISERGRRFCQELNIGFEDLSGNAYLKFGTVLIERYGKNNINKEKRNLKQLFTTKSTWLIRRMLVQPEREWTTLELAGSARISLGQVYKVTEKLAAERYLTKERGAIRLSNPGDLLDAWVEEYDFNKQPITGYFCMMKERDLLLARLKDTDHKGYALTLGAGASLVAPFVRSSDTYIYANDFDKMINALGLEPVEFGGNVYLIEPSDEGVLFDVQNIDGLQVVSNIQLYLDLYDYPARGREQAEHLRQNILGY